MAHRLKRRTVPRAVRKKIAESLKRYYKEKQREEQRRARERQQRAREREEQRARAIRSAAAEKGWETRRAQAQVDEKREAKRLKKWRASYKKYLEFRLPKKEREQLEVPAKKELVCRVLFDSDEFEERAEHIWTNFEYLVGHSVNRVLASIPGETGVVRVTFRLIEGEEFELMQAGTLEDMETEDYGVLHPLEWELDTEPRLFWSNYYANARTLLPNKPEKKGKDYQASWLGMVRLEICYAPGETTE